VRGTALVRLGRHTETMPPDPTAVFVYGTLKRGQTAHDRFLAGRILAAEPATLPGIALHAGPGFPFATEDAVAAGVVAVGELVHVDPAQAEEVLADLDWWEEVDHLHPGSGLYIRVVRAARTTDGRRVPAWVYLAGPTVRLDPATRLPSGEWIGPRPSDRAADPDDLGPNRLAPVPPDPTATA